MSEPTNETSLSRRLLDDRIAIAKGIAAALSLGDVDALARFAAAAVRLDDGGTQTLYIAVGAFEPKRAQAVLQRLEQHPAAGVDLNLLALRSMLHDRARGRLREPYGTYLDR